MKVTLIYCKEGGFDGRLALGIAYIAAFLKKNGHTVKCIDTSIYSSREEIKKVINNKEFDVYGLSVMTPYFGLGMSLSQYIRRKYPFAKIIWGGPHATVRPQEVLSSGIVDYVVMGEGEYTFNEILNNFDNIHNVSGVAYLNHNRELVINPQNDYINDLDSLPFPERSLFEINRYIEKQNKLYLLFSRGCPFSCTFCQPTLNQMFGKKIRYRSPENVIDEIKYLIDEDGVHNFSFSDDTLTVNKRKFMRFCELVLASGIEIQWEFNSRANTIDKEMMLIAAKSGARAIHIGVESGNDYIREMIYKKGYHREQIISVFKWAKEAGLSASAYFMVGAPDETISMIGDTVRLIKRIKPQKIQLSKVVPLPGTYLGDIFEKKGLIRTDMEHSYYIYIKTSITWKTNKLTESQKYWLHEAVSLEYSLKLKTSLLKMLSLPFTISNLFIFLYLFFRTILPFEVVNTVVLLIRKIWFYVRS